MPNQNNSTPSPKKHLFLWLLVFAAALCLGIFSLVQLLSALWHYSDSRKEYDSLRVQYAPAAVSCSSPVAAAQETPQPFEDLLLLNPDFRGWIQIEGAEVDHPVVQGKDNEIYLHTTFTGEKNPYGAIFLDSRCGEGFNAPYTIIYGHNSNDGGMFGHLERYLDTEYQAAHPEIIVTLPDNQQLTYHIAAATILDGNNTIYGYDFLDEKAFAKLLARLGVPTETSRVLSLSTCIGSPNKNERLLIIAVLSAPAESQG